MTDMKSGVNPLFLREEDLRQGIELLYFGWRDFTAEADAVLADLGLGRAHHRAIHFVARQPGISVGELLATLRVTKQSLSRVLIELTDRGYVTQKPGLRDRRQRLLELTPEGQALEQALSQPQRQRLARAYRTAGAEAVEGFRKVMLGLIEEADRGRFPRPAAPPPGGGPPLRPVRT